MVSEANIQLIRSVFRCREDVYAIRWEKDGKSGYMPACIYDRYMYRAHKMKGGTFQNYNDKSYLPLTDEQIAKHLDGAQLVGIYPLLQDNTSWFIAADFDEEGWQDQCKRVLSFLNEKKIPAYLERSRSGSGGHIWIFFEEPYPALRSRKILLHLLQEAGVISVFDKNTSFDRLFPNQDFLSGKGFGNLIAFPLHKPALENGNSCFIDPETFEPIPDQWKFLRSIKKVSKSDLDILYNESGEVQAGKTLLAESGKLTIILNASLILSRAGLPRPVINFLKEGLYFLNTEFIIKKKMGKNTWRTERYFRFVEEQEDSVIIPRGMAGRLLRFCKERGVEYDFRDERKKHELVPFHFTAPLREYQKLVIDAVLKKDSMPIISTV